MDLTILPVKDRPSETKIAHHPNFFDVNGGACVLDVAAPRQGKTTRIVNYFQNPNFGRRLHLFVNDVERRFDRSVPARPIRRDGLRYLLRRSSPRYSGLSGLRPKTRTPEYRDRVRRLYRFPERQEEQPDVQISK